MSIQGAFRYSKHLLEYQARFVRRQTMAITVHPNGAIEVTAPLGVTKEEIERRLRKRGRWVLRQRNYFEQFRPRSPLRRFVGGETHLYLGRQYRLKLVRHKDELVKLKGAHLVVTSPDVSNPVSVKRLLVGWYREKAATRLKERFDELASRFVRIGHLPSQPILRSMTRRWGSCTSTGRILLNPDLVRAPVRCIDYVIAHELIHLVHPDHGIGFHELFAALMPDWRHRKEKLERLLS